MKKKVQGRILPAVLIGMGAFALLFGTRTGSGQGGGYTGPSCNTMSCGECTVPTGDCPDLPPPAECHINCKCQGSIAQKICSE